MPVERVAQATLLELWRAEQPERSGPPSEKRCGHCQAFLPVESFRVEPCQSKFDPWRKWKLSSWCRPCMVEASRRWRAENPEYERAYNEARRTPPAKLECSECGVRFEGRRGRLVCSRRCRDARYRRLHPEAYAAKRARKDKRRRERRKARRS
jgi:hypothetical protein